MQGTQYAPRESILCMEHFVALQGMSLPHDMLCPHYISIGCLKEPSVVCFLVVVFLVFILFFFTVSCVTT